MDLPDTPPVLTADSIYLRPLRSDDADTIARLAAEPTIRETTNWIPKGGEAAAAAWIEAQKIAPRLAWAVVDAERDIVHGVAGLEPAAPGQDSATFRIWIGLPFQNQGLGTLAGRRLVRAAFEDWNVHRLEASHSMAIPAGERLLAGLGFLPEGVRRQAEKRGGRFTDIAHYGMLRNDFA